MKVEKDKRQEKYHSREKSRDIGGTHRSPSSFNGIKAWNYFLEFLSLIGITTLQRVGSPEENISARVLDDVKRERKSETPSCFSISMAQTGRCFFA